MISSLFVIDSVAERRAASLLQYPYFFTGLVGPAFAQSIQPNRVLKSALIF